MRFIFDREVSENKGCSEPHASALSKLRRKIARLGTVGAERRTLAFGIEAIDRVLPGGGLALGAVHEITEQGTDGARASLSALFAAGILARLPGPVIWCLHSRDLFAPALARLGLHPDRVIYCETWKDADVLPAMSGFITVEGLSTAYSFENAVLFLILMDCTQFGVYSTQSGVDMKKNLSLSSALFSGVQQRVLALIFGHPERSFYTSEIVRNVHSGRGAVERELARLEQTGLVSTEHVGNQKHYRANHESSIFNELHGIVLKTVGLAEPLRQSLIPYSKKIKVAFVYGSIAKGTDTARSDIDLMVIGDDLTYADLFAGLQKAETALHRSVNPTFLSFEDWYRKLATKDSVIAKIDAQPKLFILGSEADLKHGQTGARKSR
jgi:predicted nucleotidyltransferase